MITYRIGDDCTKYILEFLTGADLLCNVSLTCRAWAACAHDEKLIMRMLKRDYPTLVHFSESISPSVLLVKSEMGTLSIPSDPDHKEVIKTLYGEEYNPKAKRICKTTAKRRFHLSEQDLEAVDCTAVANPHYRRAAAPMLLFEVGDLLRFVCIKHQGFINFKVHMAMIEEQRSKRRAKKEERKQAEKASFLEWEREVLSNADYSGLSNDERQTMLDRILSRMGIERREDGRFAKDFIEGRVHKMHVENVAAILYLVDILFRYSHVVYSRFRDECMHEIVQHMFKHCQDTSYTWKDAVDDVHSAYANHFESTFLCRYG